MARGAAVLLNKVADCRALNLALTIVSRLEVLSLAGNSLDTWPEVLLSSWTRLQRLDLSRNLLTTIPRYHNFTLHFM
jgi:Leucine-rich repeat (LRR) protein